MMLLPIEIPGVPYGHLTVIDLLLPGEKNIRTMRLRQKGRGYGGTINEIFPIIGTARVAPRNGEPTFTCPLLLDRTGAITTMWHRIHRDDIFPSASNFVVSINPRGISVRELRYVKEAMRRGQQAVDSLLRNS